VKLREWETAQIEAAVTRGLRRRGIPRVTAGLADRCALVADAAESAADPETILARFFLDAVSLPVVVT